MSSPLLWGPNNTATNLQNQILHQNTGMLLSSNGPKNYITYNNFENGLTTGWSLGTAGTLTNGIPTGTPTFGSGAAGTLSLATVISGQLSGTTSLSFVSSTSGAAGNMFASQAYTIDAEDQAKVLTFKFYYSVISGAASNNFSGTNSNSFGIAIYDVTNTAWLTSTANFGMTQSSGVGYATGTCQTNATTASLRFVIYVANNFGSAITVYFDDFFLGPQTAPLGPSETDWVSYTPTYSAGFGTVTNNSARWKRIGDSIEIKGTCTTGTVAGSLATISLPSGYTIDTAKITISNTTAAEGAHIGDWIDSSSGNQEGPIVTATGTSTSLLYLGVTTAAGQLIPKNGNATVNTGTVFSFKCLVPVSGLSSNLQMSNDTDTRVVAGRATGVTATVTSSYSDLTWATINSDTHGAFNASSSANIYTIPVTGYYDFVGAVYVSDSSIAAGNNFVVNLFNNTSSTTLLESTYVSQGTNTTSNSVMFNFGSVLLNAGTQMKFQIKSTATSPVITSSSTENFLSIRRASGPSIIAATESVNARYFASSSSLSGSLGNITYTTKDFDSHGAYSSGTYTIPVSGKYQVNASIFQTATTTAANNLIQLQINKNGSAYSGPMDSYFTSTTSKPMTLVIDDIINCLAGDTITIQASSAGSSPSISSSNSANYFSIARIGN